MALNLDGLMEVYEATKAKQIPAVSRISVKEYETASYPMTAYHVSTTLRITKLTILRFLKNGTGGTTYNPTLELIEVGRAGTVYMKFRKEVNFRSWEDATAHVSRIRESERVREATQTFIKTAFEYWPRLIDEVKNGAKKGNGTKSR